MYGKGGSYNLFAGKDGSRGLGMSSLKPEDAVPDYTTLPENQMKVLDDWHSFFSYVVLSILHTVEADNSRLPGNGTTLLAAYPICQKQ